MSEFSPIPTLYTRKNPVLADGSDPGLSHAKKNAVGGSKNIPLTARNHPLYVKPNPARVLKHFPFYTVHSEL
jgi:hypothetical protein